MAAKHKRSKTQPKQKPKPTITRPAPWTSPATMVVCRVKRETLAYRVARALSPFTKNAFRVEVNPARTRFAVVFTTPDVPADQVAAVRMIAKGLCKYARAWAAAKRVANLA